MNADRLTKATTELLSLYARKAHNADCVGCLFSVFMVRDNEPGIIHQELFGNGDGVELGVAFALTLSLVEERLNELGPEVRAKAEAEVRAMNSLHCDDWKPL